MTDSDREHLRILSVLQYVFAGIMAFTALIPIVHVTLGFLLIFNPEALPQPRNGEMPPAWFGWLFLGIGGMVMAASIIGAIASFLNGRWLARRTHYGFCFAVSCLQCLQAPLGTALGVFTILVLNRPAVKAEFYGSQQSVVGVPPVLRS
jgi:hypothetical protein